MMWRRAKSRDAEEREAEERDRQAQQERREEQNDDIGRQSVDAFRQSPSASAPQPTDSNRGTVWGKPSDSPPGGYPPPPPSESVSASSVVVMDIRASGLGGNAGQRVTLTIKRREVPVAPEEGETPDALYRRAENRLRKEMEETVSAAGGEKIADLILPVQLPTAAAQVEDLKSDLHKIMLGRLTDVPQLGPYIPLPGIDRPLDTAELAILVGGIVFSAVTASPVLYGVCFKSLGHKAIANTAEKAIKAALFDYEGPLPSARPRSEAPLTIPPVSPSPSPGNPGDMSPADPKSKSPRGPGISLF
jgi:hypothetical protein